MAEVAKVRFELTFLYEQDLMDELLQSVYPVYSVARELTIPHKVKWMFDSCKMMQRICNISRLCETTVRPGQDRR